jgi:hypothetical protein
MVCFRSSVISASISRFYSILATCQTFKRIHPTNLPFATPQAPCHCEGAERLKQSVVKSQTASPDSDRFFVAAFAPVLSLSEESDPTITAEDGFSRRAPRRIPLSAVHKLARLGQNSSSKSRKAFAFSSP